MSILKCPYCEQYIEIIEINCGIFRCGLYKTDCSQLNPHASREECERVVAEDRIFGCGKPFRVYKMAASEYRIEKCEYI